MKPEDGTAYVDAGLQLESTFHYRVPGGRLGRPGAGPGGMVPLRQRRHGQGRGGDRGAVGPLGRSPGGEQHPADLARAPDEGRGLRYRIDHSTDGETWETLRSSHTGTCTVDGETLQCYTHGGLLSGTEHHYRVAIVRGGAFGPWAYFLPETTPGAATTVPGIPENLRLTSLGRASATIAWDPPARDGGTRITGYEYQVFGPCLNPGPDETADYCHVVPPTRTGGTSRDHLGPERPGHLLVPGAGAERRGRRLLGHPGGRCGGRPAIPRQDRPEPVQSDGDRGRHRHLPG